MSTRPMTRLAKTEDLRNIAALQRIESNRVGFVPYDGLAMYVSLGMCAVAETRDSQIVAYILGRPSLRYARWCRPITQLVVHPDFRRMGIATWLITRRIADAKDAELDCVQAWTRADLTGANRMWEALGFVMIAERNPHTARGKASYLWRFPMTAVGHTKLTEIPNVGGHKGRRMDGQATFAWTISDVVPRII